MKTSLGPVLAVLVALAAIDAAVATAGGAMSALLCAIGAAVLALLGAAALWTRPLVAATLAYMWIALAFAASAVILGSVNAPTNIRFTGLSPDDSAAVVLAAAITVAALAGMLVFRNAAARIAIALLALYALAPTVASVGRGGLPAAFTNGPLAFTRGTYAASNALLPLAAIVAIVVAFACLIRRRGAAGATALTLAIALLASSNLGAFTAGVQGLPTIAAFEHPATARELSSTTVSRSTAGSSDALNVSPTSLPSMRPATGALSAPQPTIDYTSFIGPNVIDDGMASQDFGSAAVSAVNRVVGAFGTQEATAPPQSEMARRFRDADARIPDSEYSLDALAKTLPDDPLALYRFVRDGVDLDAYDGIMRGPLGTWLSRAGGPSDKLALFASLLIKKHVPFQFVRGTLSDAERDRVARAAGEPTNDFGTVEDANVRSTVEQYVKDGSAFASWASQQLSGAGTSLGRPNATARIGSRHYWLQVDHAGKAFDLDPGLRDMREGEHLGSLDPSFKPWAMLPADEWHYIQVRVIGEFADGSRQQVIEYHAKTADVAYSPLRLGVIPHGAADFAGVATARVFDVVTLNGSAVSPTQRLDLDAHGGMRRIWMEIRRKDSHDGLTVVSRDLVTAATRRDLQGPALAGLTTLLVVPGAGANAFLLHEYFKTLAALADAAAKAKDEKIAPLPVYPLRIADYFSRDDLVAARLGAEAHARLYRDRPDVSLQRTWFQVRGGAAEAVTGFDIVDNGMEGAGGDPKAVATANLARGYADTQIERDVTGNRGSNGTIAIFDAAKNAGVKPVVVTKTDGIPSSVQPLARGLDATLGAGNVAIAPSAAVSLDGRLSFGWWDVDPSNGNAVGRVTGGWGAAMPEYAMIVRFISTGIWVMELAQTAHECREKGCIVAICSNFVGAIFLGAGWKHAAHVHSINGLVLAVAFAIVTEIFVAQGVGSMCGSEPGGHGGGGGPGGHGGGAPGGHGGSAPSEPYAPGG